MRLSPFLSLVLVLAAAPSLAVDDPTPESSMTTPATVDLTASWEGPFGGVPSFSDVPTSAFAPAIDAAISEYLGQIDTIASEKGKPTFDNTIVPLEGAGKALDRALTVYFVYSGTMSSPELREVEKTVAPKLAGLSDKIYQNTALFERIDAIYNGKRFRKLDAEQQRLVWRIHTNFVRRGARLDPEAKARLAEVNQELAGLYTSFSQNLLADEDTFITLESEEELTGLPASLVSAMAAQATSRGLEGKWIVVNTRSSVDPFLTLSQRRDLREKVWRAFVSRGDNGDDHDNKAFITRILKLRAERARLLGYETHAHWRLADSMAGSPDKALALMEGVWKPAVARVQQEVADQQAIADAEGAGITIEPWDYRFYQEKVRKQRYDLDQDEVKAYLELESLREGMFWAAGRLYGMQFEQVEGLPVVHPDVRVWEVKDAEGGHVGLWYFDPYARSGKRSGAWMNAYRGQQRMDGEITPIVSNNSNFVKGAPGEPVLISWDDARTMFHEFGHALHGLSSDVTYPSLAGTSVARDFVEFPSQLNEHWLADSELLSRFARHHETGEPMPQALRDRLEAAATFNQGFATVEYLASAYLDMRLHLAGDADIDAASFEKETLAELGMPDEIVMRHRLPQFAHIFAGDGYSAGYYSYLWADTLTADAAEAFHEAGSLYDEDVAKRYHDTVLSVGNTVDAAEAFRAFRGRDVDVSALMRDRGFPVE